MNNHELVATDQLECALAQYGCPARLSALDCGRGRWGVFVNELPVVCLDALVQAANRLGYTVTEWRGVGKGTAAWLEKPTEQLAASKGTSVIDIGWSKSR
jgi:hypothetical protein